MPNSGEKILRENIPPKPGGIFCFGLIVGGEGSIIKAGLKGIHNRQEKIVFSILRQY